MSKLPLIGLMLVLTCGSQTIVSNQTDTEDSLQIPSDVVLFYDENTGVLIELPSSWRVTTSSSEIKFYNYPEDKYTDRPPGSDLDAGDMQVIVTIEENTSGINEPTAFLNPDWYINLDMGGVFELPCGGRAVTFNGLDTEYWVVNGCIALCDDLVITLKGWGDGRMIPDNLRTIAETIRVR